MKATILILLLACIQTHGQSWQWGKRGGGDEMLANTSLPEQVTDMATDSQGNIFILSPVASLNLDIDGNPASSHDVPGAGGTSADCVLASFTCNGTFRWSKVFGGKGTDKVERLQLDADGNVYAVAKFSFNGPNDIGIHFDNDLVLPASPENVNANKESNFIFKYSNSGVFQWAKTPQPFDVNLVNSFFTNSIDLQTDQDGNSWWLMALRAGTYGGGYTVSSDNTIHVLKYDSAGNFIGGMPLDMHPGSTLNVKMVRDHNSGNLYLAGSMRSNSDVVIFNNQQITGNTYLAAYNADGGFLWLKQNGIEFSFQSSRIFDISIGSQGNVYITGTAESGFNFDGYVFTSTTATSPFIYKYDSNGVLLWAAESLSTNQSNLYLYSNAITEGAITGAFVGTVNWDGFTISTPQNSLYEPFLARFNPATGEIIGLEALYGSMGYSDYGTAICRDVHNNFYIGGSMEHFLYVNSTEPLVNNGAQTDFFIAKFGSSDCSLSTGSIEKSGIKIWPNPSKDLLFVEGLLAPIQAEVYDVAGKKLTSIILTPEENRINVEELAAGLYFIKFDGLVFKILKR